MPVRHRYIHEVYIYYSLKRKETENNSIPKTIILIRTKRPIVSQILASGSPRGAGGGGGEKKIRK